MKIKIIGSGGCTAIPRALCECKICVEAREKGVPYARFGPSIYIEDINTLIDTPEDINTALNYHDIKKIDNIFYSHWDPDHSLGIRLLEQLKLNWADVTLGIKNDNPINLYGRKNVLDDLFGIRSPRGSFLEYYQKVRNLVKVIEVEDEIKINNLNISFVNVHDTNVTVFVFEENGKKIVYAPCDVKPFPDNEKLKNADILIIGDSIPTFNIKDNFYIDEKNSFRKELLVMDEIIKIKSDYNIKKVIVTHLEEIWGLSYDDYLDEAKKYDNIEFAFDGMEIEI